MIDLFYLQKTNKKEGKNETTLILCGYKANKWTDTGFPQMGEEGCGSRNPTCFNYYFFTTLKFLEKEPLFDPKKLVKMAYKLPGKEGERRRGEVGWISSASEGLKPKISAATTSHFCSTC